jgi:hypothetical protein
VDAVKESLAGRAPAGAFLSSLTRVLDESKNTIYSEDLQAFDKNKSLYDQGDRGLGEYVHALTRFDGRKGEVLSRLFPNIDRFLSVLQKEKGLDFTVVERDRRVLVEKLIEKTTQADLQDLVRRSVDLRGGKTSHTTYHAYLRNLCQRNGCSLSSYPSLTAYMDYVAASEEIDREALLIETVALEASAENALAKTPDQRKLVGLSQDVSRLKKLVNNEMTPDDWAGYKGRKMEMRTIPERMSHFVPTEAVRWPQDMAKFLSPFERFCALAMDRNAALAGRLMEKMKGDRHSLAILVAGGFHTDGLVGSLAEHGASVAVLTPKISQVDPDHRYLDAFAQDPLPLEQIFNGEPISIKTECALARDSTLGREARDQLHKGVLTVMLDKLRVLRLSEGVPLAELKRELNQVLADLLAQNPWLARLNPFLITLTPTGLKLNFAEASGNISKTQTNGQGVTGTSESTWTSPTLREEWKIAWRESVGFLSPVTFFWGHDQWKGTQKIIGGLLILGLWVIMGETATLVVEFISTTNLAPSIAFPASWGIGAVIGWFATLPSHVAWNRLAEKTNVILSQKGYAFRLPRLTLSNPQGRGNDTPNWVSNFRRRETVAQRALSEFPLNQWIPLTEALMMLTGIHEKNHWTKVINDIVNHQFTSPLRGVVEAVTNGLDAGAKKISVSYEGGRLAIRDDGSGMGREELLKNLLVPKISGQMGREENRGQFGVGFYALLGLLKAEGDSLTLNTTKGGKTHELRYEMRGAQIQVQLKEIEEVNQNSIGTAISIAVADLPAEFLVTSELSRGLAYLVGTPIEYTSSDGETFIINDIPKESERKSLEIDGGYLTGWPLNQGEWGNVVLTVMGLTVLTVTTNSSHNVILEISDKTVVPRARNDLNFKEGVDEFLKDLIGKVVQSGDQNLINGLAILLNKIDEEKGFDFASVLIEKWLVAVKSGSIKGPFLPDIDALSEAKGVRVPPLLFEALGERATGLTSISYGGMRIYIVKGTVTLNGEKALIGITSYDDAVGFMAESDVPTNDLQWALVDAFLKMIDYMRESQGAKKVRKLAEEPLVLKQLILGPSQKFVVLYNSLGFNPEEKIHSLILIWKGGWYSFFNWNIKPFERLFSFYRDIQVRVLQVAKSGMERLRTRKIKFSLSLLPQLMGNEFAQAKWQEVFRKIRRQTPRNLNEVGIQYMQGALRTSVDNQNADPFIFVRENLQNARDAAFQRREQEPAFQGKLSVSIEKTPEISEASWKIIFEDNVGMDPNDVVRYLLIPGMSSKDGDDTSTGKFGQGFFSNLRGADSVTFKTGKNGQTTTVVFTPIRGSDGILTDVHVQMEISKGPYQGSRIEVIRNGAFYMGQESVQNALTKSGEWLDPEVLQVFLEREAVDDEEKSVLINNRTRQEEAIRAKVETPLGTLTIYKSDSGFNHIYHRGLPLKPLEDNDDLYTRAKVPPSIRSALDHAGLVVDLPARMEVVGDRSGIVDPETIYAQLAVPIYSAALMAVGNLLARREIQNTLLPYDWMSRSVVSFPEQIEKHAFQLARGELSLDSLDQYQEDTAVGQLLFAVPLWGNLSMKDISTLGPSIKTYQDTGLLIQNGVPPGLIGQILWDNVLKPRYDNAGSQVDPKDPGIKRTVRSNYSLATDPGLYGFHAFIIWAREVARRAVRLDSSITELDDVPSVAFSTLINPSVAFVKRHSSQIDFNLLSEESVTYVERFLSLLRGETNLSSPERQDILGWVLEVITHESVHVLEGTGEGAFTHDANFFRRQGRLLRLLSAEEVSRELLALLGALTRPNAPNAGVESLFRKPHTTEAPVVPGAMGLWDRFSLTRNWSLAQRGLAEGRATGLMYLVGLAGVMAFGFVPLAPPGVDFGSLILFTLASVVNPISAFVIAFVFLSLMLHRMSGVKFRLSDSPVQDWPTVVAASFKSLSGLAGVPFITVGVSLAVMGGAFGLGGMVGGIAVGAMMIYAGVRWGGEVHRKINERVEMKNAARDSVRHVFAEELRNTFLGGESEAMRFDGAQTPSRAALIEQINTGSMGEAIKQLSLIGQIKEGFVLLSGKLKEPASDFVLKVYARAGQKWASQSEGPLNVGAHDFARWSGDGRLLAFFQGAIQTAIRSNRPVFVAAQPTDQSHLIRLLGLEEGSVYFTVNGVQKSAEGEGAVLDARAFMGDRKGTLLVADLNSVINHEGIHLMVFHLLSQAVAEEIRALSVLLQNA